MFQQIKNITKKTFFKIKKNEEQPLLNENEILELFYRCKNNKKSLQQKNDIAFKQIGDSQSIYRGQGMDYEESRRYQPGDDPRYMNWQVSAKTGQYYMKVFREERQPGVFILVDRRHSMRFGTQNQLKITQAVRVAAIAAFSAQENNHSIGGVIIDDDINWIKESNNKQSSFNFITQAAHSAPALFEKEINEPNLIDILSMLNEVLVAGSTVYLISDFHDLKSANQPTLLQLSTKHQIYAIQITDPAEHVLPKAGNITLKPSRFGEQQQLNSNSLKQQENYKAAANDYFASKKSLLEDVAISYQTIFTTDNDIEDKIIL